MLNPIIINSTTPTAFIKPAKQPESQLNKFNNNKPCNLRDVFHNKLLISDKISFGEVSLFEKRLRKHPLMLESEWFREITPEKLDKIQREFTRIYKQTPGPNMLIAGVACAEEPFSYLAILSDMKNQQNPKSLIDLHCVDLEPEITSEELEDFAYYTPDDTEEDEVPEEPLYAQSSFRFDENQRRWKVNRPIVDYLKEIFEHKTSWNKDIVDFAQEEKAKGNKYKVISCNHVFQYLPDNQVEFTARNLVEILEPGGILLCNYKLEGIIADINEKESNFKKIANGIWRKINS